MSISIYRGKLIIQNRKNFNRKERNEDTENTKKTRYLQFILVKPIFILYLNSFKSFIIRTVKQNEIY